MKALVKATHCVLSLPLHLNFAISKGSLQRAQNVFVELMDSDGLEGLGEAAPFPVLTGDDVGTVSSLCEDYLPALIGLSPVRALELVQGVWRSELFGKSPTFLTAIETALFDLIAKDKGLSLAMLWGPHPSFGLQTDMTLPVLSTPEVETFWAMYKDCGFKEIKVKVGSPQISDDIDRIAALVQFAPHLERLSLDGNQAFDVDRALALLSGLARIGVTPALFEQPLPKDDLTGMIKLTDKSPVPIFADETVVTIEDVENVIQRRAAHGINLKIMKSGIKESIEMGRLAKEAGFHVMIGGMLESEVAMTTSLHLACATGLVDWNDLDTPFFIKERVTEMSPYHKRKAFLERPTAPGLGLQLKRQPEAEDEIDIFFPPTGPEEHPYRKITGPEGHEALKRS